MAAPVDPLGPPRRFPRAHLLLAPWRTRLPLPRHRRIRRTQALRDATIARLIQAPRTQETPPSDAADGLSLLLTAHEGVTALTVKQVCDHALTLWRAGPATTPVA